MQKLNNRNLKLKEKNIKGITLIALVITIIVLLILAGVSIAMLTGQNGILSQARRAEGETKNSQVEEEGILDSYEDYISNAIGEVRQVDDSNPGILEGSGIEEEPFVINSIEDLVIFADNVTKGTNNYQDQYVKLGLSLDFNSDKSYVDPNREDYTQYGYDGNLKQLLTSGEGFIPIGSTNVVEQTDKNKSFCGYFDGDGNTIINCYMNKEVSGTDKNYYGFFGMYLFGEVKNLGLTEVNYNLINKRTPEVISGAGISGIVHYSLGKISNCYVSGNITETVNGGAETYCAGIVSNNNGIIDSCYNLATINGIIINNTPEHACFVAGITINNESESSEIRNCYNLGKINAKANSGVCVEVGGIAKYQNLGTIENCFNIGDINCEITGTINGYSRIGGIIGFAISGNVTNVYNSGDINIVSDNKNIYAGGIVGENRNNVSGSYNIGKINNVDEANNCWIGEIFGVATENASSSNSFYVNNQAIGLNYSNSCITTQVTSKQLKSNETLTLLNQDGIIWKKDTSNINNGYPIFTWQ